MPFTKIIQVPTTEYVEIPIERLVADTKYHEDTIDIPLTQEVVKEVVEDVYKEKVFHLVKEVSKPKFIPKYVDRYVDKFVDINVYVPQIKIVEIVSEKQTDKPCEVVTNVQRLNVKGINIPRPMNTFVKREVLSENLKRRFDDASRTLGQAIEENIKMKAQLDGLRNLQRAGAHTIDQRVNDQMINQLRSQVQSMEQSLRVKEDENNRVRHQLGQERQIEQVVNYDREMIPVLQEQIRNIKEHNAYLRDLARQGQFYEEVVEVGSQVVGHNVTGGVREPRQVVTTAAPLSGSASYYSGSYSSRSSRSGSPSPVYRQPLTSAINPVSRVAPPSPRLTQPIQRVVGANQVYQTAPRRSSPAPVMRMPGSPRIVGGQTPGVSHQYVARGNGRVIPSRSSSAYSSGGSQYSSYSSRSPSPAPAQRYESSIRQPLRSNYQTQVDAVYSPFPRQSVPVSARASPFDFMNSGRSTYQSMAGAKPFSTASTMNPSTFGNTGKLIGDYSMINQAKWGS